MEHIITFFSSIASFIFGYYFKDIADHKKAKKLKILQVGLDVSRACVKTYNPLGYLPPTISIKLENPSKTDIAVKGIILKSKDQLDIFPAQLVLKSDTKEVKQYEIVTLNYVWQKRYYTHNPKTDEITNEYIKLIETPKEFFNSLHWYFFHSTSSAEKWKDFEKKISKLRIIVKTNIGEYERKLKKKEIKYFKIAMQKEFEKTKNTSPVTLGSIG